MHIYGHVSRDDNRRLVKPSLVRSSHGYQCFMRCRYSSASGGYRLLVPSDRAVICSVKPLRSYLLADFIKRYINKLILYYITTTREISQGLIIKELKSIAHFFIVIHLLILVRDNSKTSLRMMQCFKCDY